MEEKPNILVIEDDPLHRIVLRKGLTRNDLNVDLAENGEEARQLLESKGDQYDLVLLDMDLPDTTGLKVLEIIRGLNDQNSLPVIIFSGNEKDSNVIQGLEQGANDYVFKSVELPVLLARIRGLLVTAANHDKSISETQTQVMQESLGAACHHIAQPMTVATTSIEILCDEEKEKNNPIIEQLNEIKHWIKASGAEIHRLQNIDVYRTTEYAAGVNIIDTAPHTEDEEADEAE